MKTMGLIAALALAFAIQTKAADSSSSGTVVIGGSFFTELNSLTIKATDCGTDLTSCSAALDTIDFSTATNSVNLGNVTAARYVAVQFVILGKLFSQDYLKVAASVSHNTNTTDLTVSKLRYLTAGGGTDLAGFSGAADLPEAADVLLNGTSQVLWDQSSSLQGTVQATPIAFLTAPTRLEVRGILKIDSSSSSTSTPFQSTVNFTWTAKDGTP